MEGQGRSRFIADVKLGAYNEDKSIIHKDTSYGFCFKLPFSWQGHATITDTWLGSPMDMTLVDDTIAEGGSLNLLQHPHWTGKNPRQDIPIMVFAHQQWDLIRTESLRVSAAPIGPKELGQNDNMFFLYLPVITTPFPRILRK